MKLSASLIFFLIAGFALGQNFLSGDFAVLGVNANTLACSGVAEGDEISFVCFKDILPGMFFDITDNGWEPCMPQRWGDAEGTIRITRTGSTIPAGTVITYRLVQVSNFGTYQFISPDNNWAVTNLNTGLPAVTPVNMNTGGDQLFFLSGGNWQNGGITQDNDAHYSGEVVFGFNTHHIWQAQCNPNPARHSNLPPCFSSCNNIAPNSAGDFVKYTGALTPATQLEWIERLRNPLNWTQLADCHAYELTTPNFASGFKINVLSLPFSITGGPNGVCRNDTAYLGLMLPPTGAPFTIGWSDGANHFSASNIINGMPLPVVPQQSSVFQITFLQDNSGCAVRIAPNGGFFLEVYPNDTVKISQTTCRASDVGTFVEKHTNRRGCDSVVIRQVLLDAVACQLSFHISKEDVTCNGSSDGQIVVVPTVGSPPFEVYIKNESSGEIWRRQALQLKDSIQQKKLAPATYLVQLIDANGVSDSVRVSIANRPALAGNIRRISDFSGYALPCHSATNGKARAEVTGGTPPYQYVWHNGITTAHNDALQVGVASVTVADAMGCQLILTTTMTAPDSLVAQLLVRGESCSGKNNGEVWVENISGGVPPYAFSMHNQPFSNVQHWKNLSPGLYRIHVQDAAGCQKTFKALLPEGSSYDFSIGQDTCIFSGERLIRLPQATRRIDSLVFQPKAYAHFDPASGFAIFSPPVELTFKITAIDETGCLAYDTIRVCVLRDRSVFVPNVFAPNSYFEDNRKLTVFSDSGVEEILSFRIFNRYGTAVFECFWFSPNDPSFSWDGNVRGQPAPPDVYVWHLTFRASDGRTGERNGDVLLVR